MKHYLLTQVTEEINCCDAKDLMRAWNAYATSVNKPSIFKNNSEGYVDCFGNDVAECSRAMLYGTIDKTHSYFYLDGNRNVVTAQWLAYTNFDTDELAEWLIESDENIAHLGNYTLLNFTPDLYNLQEEQESRLITHWNDYTDEEHQIHVIDNENIIKVVGSLAKFITAETTNYQSTDRYFTYDGEKLVSFNKLYDDKSPFDMAHLL